MTSVITRNTCGVNPVISRIVTIPSSTVTDIIFTYADGA